MEKIEQPTNNSENNNFLKYTIIISIVVLVVIFVMFFWNQMFFEFDRPVDSGMLGTLGDFIGGVIGSIWAFMGVILFYYALKEQRKDIKINKKALKEQINALKVQTNEFSLQKEELKQSRNVFIEQSKTLKKQQFESTFFSMMEMYHSSLSKMNSIDNNDYFVEFSKELQDLINLNNNPFDNFLEANKNYKKLYFIKRNDISHYFRIVYRIMRFIETSSMTEKDKVDYAKIIRSQFSEKEQLILYYNSQSILGFKFIPLALKYNLFKHLPSGAKFEFGDYSTDDSDIAFNRLIFFNELILIIREFLSDTNEENINVDYPSSRSFEKKEVGLFLRIEIMSSEINEVNISLIDIDINKFENYFGLKLNNGINYFSAYFHHIFIFSKYVDYDSLNYVITSNSEEQDLTFNIKNNKQIDL